MPIPAFDRIVEFIMEIIKLCVDMGYLDDSVGHLTLSFGSGHDLKVLKLSPTLGSVLSRESA